MAIAKVFEYSLFKANRLAAGNLLFTANHMSTSLGNIADLCLAARKELNNNGLH